MALVGALVGVDRTDAAATGRSWRAPVGNGWPTQQAASNGFASIDLYWTGAGILTLELNHLVRSTAYSVTLFKGPFIAAGTSWSSRAGTCASLSDGPVVRLPAIKSTAGGTIVRTVSLSPSQMSAINAIPRKIAITVGSGRLARCGGFQLLAPSRPATAPSSTPSPTVASSPFPPPTCSSWPAQIADMLAVLTTPDGLCLLRYPTLAEAPEFLEGLDGAYTSLPPTIHYLIGTAGRETAILAHEVCHAHQDRVTNDEGLTDFVDGWYRTAAGEDYLRETGWRLQGGRWIDDPEAILKRPEAISSTTSPLEDNAGACALWFDPAFGPRFLRRWAPIRFAWAQRWLPLPPFIVPWQGAQD